jgi:hypothetical protein
MKHARAVTLLIQSGGADPSIPDPDGRTTLHLFAEPLYICHNRGLSDTAIEDTHLTRALTTWLQQGTNSTIFNQRDNTGATALHIATCGASAPVVVLLALGADPNLTFTPQPKDSEAADVETWRTWRFWPSGDEDESVPGPTTGNGEPDTVAGAGHGRG